MNMPMFVERILETEFIGRLVRKFLWLTKELTHKVYIILAQAFELHPYVRKLNRGTISGRAKVLHRYFEMLKDSLDRMKDRPRFTVFIIDDGLPNFPLAEIEKSLEFQVDRNFDVIVVSISQAKDLGLLLANATGDYVVFLGRQQRLVPQTLAEISRFTAISPDVQIIYADEMCLENNTVFYKPAWSPLLFLSNQYIGRTVFFSRTLMPSAVKSIDSSELLVPTLILKLAIEDGIKVHHLPIVLSATRQKLGALPNAAAGQSWLQQIESLKIPTLSGFVGVYHESLASLGVSFSYPNQPLISIIIPSKNGFDLIGPCLKSIFERTKYSNFEIIIIDHESTDQNVTDLYKMYLSQKAERFRIIPFKGSFNFAAMNNLGVAASRGEYVILLNNDTEVLGDTWLENLLAFARQPHVGACGAKLDYPDNEIQHAGISTVGSAIAAHQGLKLKSTTNIYFNYLQLTHEVSIVTGACLMINKQRYLDVGGLDETSVPNGFGDVDFCLKLRSKGFTNIYVATSLLIHKESKTRSHNIEIFERIYMLDKWKETLLKDSYLNPAMESTLKPLTYYADQVLPPPYLEALLLGKRLETLGEISWHGWSKQ